MKRLAASAGMDAGTTGLDRGWSGLRTLIRARVLVGLLALPVGVLFGSQTAFDGWTTLLVALLALGALSGVWWAGLRLRRWLDWQVRAQLLADVVFVTALAATTGGRESQFVLFFAPVVIAGGLLQRVAGGVAAAVAASAAYVALPWVVRLGDIHNVSPLDGGTPPGLVIAYLGMMGVLAGVLGDRARRTRDDLDRATRELDRVRVDNDVILRHLTTGVLTVDGSGTVAYLNPAAEQVLGLSDDACRGIPIGEALPAGLTPLRDLIGETLRSRSRRARAELTLRTSTGRPLPLGISTNLLMHEGRLTGVVAVFQDLTEVHEMERRARRNETLAEIGALSARIAHELRNGLNPISGSVEYLQREIKPQGEDAVLMDLILTECGRLNRFVSDLLNYSRERDVVPEPLDLEEQLAELCEVVGRDPRCAAGVTVRYESAGRPGPMLADREQIRQVWLNLASNALDAMPSGGTLTVRWSDGEDDQRIVEFIDDGLGIAAEDLPRVGQPFFTTKQRGTGLGLAIATRILERHGGALTFESAPERGTTARVNLPTGTVTARAA